MLALLPVFAGLVGSVGQKLIDALFAKKQGDVKPADPKPDAKSADAQPKPVVSLEQLAVNGKYYAGIAYATYLVDSSGEPRRVDAANHQFHTGDKFLVRYVANMPGRIDISNINPHGHDTALGTWPVAAGEQVTIPARGTFQFTGDSGDEGLMVFYTPCTSGVPSRDITINATATVNYSALLPLCSQRSATPRDVAVSAEDGMGYAVSELDKNELAKGNAQTRAFMIRFRHMPATADSRGWLITPEEADQPASRQLVPSKSDPDGPSIEVRQPGEVKDVVPPIHIDVAFVPKEGHTIDFKTLKVTYLKLFDIDITDRLKPYITPTGLHSDNAKLPPGDHTIEISVKDDAGHGTTALFSFKVLKPQG
jgi:hypothetical protein